MAKEICCVIACYARCLHENVYVYNVDGRYFDTPLPFIMIRGALRSTLVPLSTLSASSLSYQPCPRICIWCLLGVSAPPPHRQSAGWEYRHTSPSCAVVCFGKTAPTPPRPLLPVCRLHSTTPPCCGCIRQSDETTLSPLSTFFH